MYCISLPVTKVLSDLIIFSHCTYICAKNSVALKVRVSADDGHSISTQANK